MRSDLAKESGDISRAIEFAEEAVAIERTGHQDLHAFALTAEATLRIMTGTIGEGIELLEEAAIAAVNGELSPLTAGITACQMIAACRDLTDYRRASEWIELTDHWCETQSVGGFPGVCRVHRAEIAASTGAGSARRMSCGGRPRSSRSSRPSRSWPTGSTRSAIFGGCRAISRALEDVLRQAHALGRSPQPALALIRLESGKVKLAAAAIGAALAESSWDAMARLRLLGAQVEITLRIGDTARARMATDQLAEMVDEPARLRCAPASPMPEAGCCWRRTTSVRLDARAADGASALARGRVRVRDRTHAGCVVVGAAGVRGR